MYGDILHDILTEMDMTITELSLETGIGKSSISQYLSNKHEPPLERKEKIAEALGVPLEYFQEDKEEPPPMDAPNLPVETAAKLMGKSKEFVYKGLQEGIFPWGYALKMGSHWSYYISAKRFREEVCGD